MEKILIIDDDVQYCKQAAENIRKEGFIVFEAFNPGVGHKKIREENPDLILLDIVMRGMDGIEVLQALKESGEKTTRIPIIMITGNDPSAEEMLKCIELGAIDYLPKPINFDHIIISIEKALRLKTRINELDREIISQEKEIEHLKSENKLLRGIIPWQQRVAWIFIVGISKYANPNLMDLPGVAEDISRLRYTLTSEYKTYRIGSIWTLLDEKASKKNIDRHIQDLIQSARFDDLVIMYFAGHGIDKLTTTKSHKKNKKHRYFLPFDATEENVEFVGIGENKFGEFLKNIRANQLVLVIDCCYSGGLTGLWPDLDRIQLEALDGIIIATSGPEEQAGETSGGGFFIKGFCDALEGKIGHIQHNGEISVQQAYRCAAELVEKTYEIYDHPQHCTQHSVGNNIIITKVK